VLEIIDCEIQTKSWFITLPDIQVQKNELLVITGSSGIGKSTLLNWLLGNIPQHVTIKGQIMLSGNNITKLDIEQRRVGLLMQDVYLFPHLNVQDNICFALPKTPQQSSKKQRRLVAMNMLDEIDLVHLATRYPQNLSGGERSRVGLIRALANQPQAMLLDEPFAALDPNTRAKMGAWAFQQLAKQNIPTVMVSHDVEDIPPSSKQLCLADYFYAIEQKKADD
jgi:putative thiamine transport system ATP-binding protein